MAQLNDGSLGHRWAPHLARLVSPARRAWAEPTEAECPAAPPQRCIVNDSRATSGDTMTPTIQTGQVVQSL